MYTCNRVVGGASAPNCSAPVCSNTIGSTSSSYPCQCGLSQKAATRCIRGQLCTATSDTDGICQETCAAFACDPGYSKIASANALTSPTKEKCCENTCEGWWLAEKKKNERNPRKPACGYGYMIRFGARWNGLYYEYNRKAKKVTSPTWEKCCAPAPPPRPRTIPGFYCRPPCVDSGYGSAAKASWAGKCRWVKCRGCGECRQFYPSTPAPMPS